MGIRLSVFELRPISPAWAALMDWAEDHQHGKITELRFENGEPVVGDHELSAATREKVRFLRSRQEEALAALKD
jgi:DNA-binding GntR family transcriptional regulator